MNEKKGFLSLFNCPSKSIKVLVTGIIAIFHMFISWFLCYTSILLYPFIYPFLFLLIHIYSLSSYILTLSHFFRNRLRVSYAYTFFMTCYLPLSFVVNYDRCVPTDILQSFLSQPTEINYDRLWAPTAHKLICRQAKHK